MDGPSHIEVFLKDRIRDLKRIAARTKGEFTFEDLGSEAWLIAGKLADRRGYAVDFRDVDDQEQVLAWLYKRFVAYADKTLRKAQRLDLETENEDGRKVLNALANLLSAPETTDPLVFLQTQEDEIDYADLVRVSYSQASAYVVLLVRFGRNELATYLSITHSTLVRRIHRAVAWRRTQPSIFDGIATIDNSFMPARGREKTPLTTRWVRILRSSWELWPSNV